MRPHVFVQVVIRGDVLPGATSTCVSTLQVFCAAARLVLEQAYRLIVPHTLTTAPATYTAPTTMVCSILPVG
jgi:hypothetical protein